MNALKHMIVRFLWRRLPSCKEVVSLISRKRDAGITPIQQLRVKLHLLLCSWCTRYARQIDLMASGLNDGRRYDHSPVPLDLLTRLKKNVRDRL